MFRTLFLSIVFTVMLGLCGCGGSGADSSKFVFSTDVTALYNGRSIEASGVLWEPMLNTPQGYVRGEAVILDLGNDKRAYLLFNERNRRGRIHFGALQKTFKSVLNPNEDPISAAEEKKRLLVLPVGSRGQWSYQRSGPYLHGRYYGYPLVVAFEDEADPSSVFLVETEKPVKLFGKMFDFKDVYIERVAVNTPLTNELVAHLPWVRPGHIYWEKMRLSGAGNGLASQPHGMLAKDATFAQDLSRTNFVSSDRKYR